MDNQEMVGKTSDDLICKTLGIDWFFKIISSSSHMNMAIVEYVPDGGNCKIAYKHWDDFIKLDKEA